MHGVDAAPADVVVRVIEDQEPPGLVDERHQRFAATTRGDRERLRDALEEPLRPVVRQLEVDARGPDAGEDRIVLVPEQLARVHRERRAGSFDVVEVRGDAAVHELDLGQRRAHIREQGRQLWLERHVVASVQEDRAARRQATRARRERRGHALDGQFDARLEPLEVAERLGQPQSARIEVAVAQVDGRHLAAIAGAPAELATQTLPLFAREPAHEQERAQPEAAQDHRHLRDVSERVGHVPVTRLRAQSAREPEPPAQVADQRLPAGQERIGQDEPWAQFESTVRHERADPGARLGSDRQVVLDQRHLAIEREGAERRVLLEQLEQPVDELDEVDPVLLEGEVPRAVPVRMGHDDGA